MCGKIATSREHAPPRCLFPEAKDTSDGSNYRRNLITVPACEEHNAAKSHDDEYLLFALAGSYTSSTIGLNQFLSKVRRAFKRQPIKASDFIERSIPVQLRRPDQNCWENGLQVHINVQRVDRVLDSCARALYFHETGQKFRGPAQVLTQFTMYEPEEIQRNVTNAFTETERVFASLPARGENSDIFWYKFQESSATALFYFRFYKASAAMVRFRKILLATQ